MSIFSKIIKGVGNVAADVFKATVVEPVASSVNSVLNKEKIDVKYSTKFGKSVGGIAEVSTDTLHGALKKVGNAFTGGYADKVADLIRTDDAKSSVVGISEFGGQKEVFKKGPLKTAGNAIQVVGSVVGDIVGAAAADKAASNFPRGEAGGTSAANMVSVNSNKNMSFLSNALTGVQNFAKSPIGQAAGNMLGSVLTNIVTPKKSNNVAQAAQQVVLQQSQNSLTPMTSQALSPVSAAALGVGDLGEILKQVGNNGKKESSLPVWLWPVVGGVAFVGYYNYFFIR